jgi:hypothetical protein
MGGAAEAWFGARLVARAERPPACGLLPKPPMSVLFQPCPLCYSFRTRRPLTIRISSRARSMLAALQAAGVKLRDTALRSRLHARRPRARDHDGFVSLVVPPGLRLLVRYEGPRRNHVRILHLTLARSLARALTF